MRVTVRGIGDLRDYMGREPWEAELPDGACVRDLLEKIEQRWGAEFPAYLWDFEKHQFRGPVYLVVNKKAVQQPETPLQDGMEIRVMRAIAGGSGIYR